MTTGNLLLDRQLARWYPLHDHPVQLDLIKAVQQGIRFPLVPAGRRCLEAGTMVATPSGPRAIESLRIGDEVIGFDENGAHVTTVSATWDNGEQIVYPLNSRGRKVLAATANHKLWACHEQDFQEGKPAHGYSRREVSSLTKRHRVRKQYAYDLIGSEGKSMPLAYALGALLGDGCSRDNRHTHGRLMRQLNISAACDDVPAKIASMLGCGFRRKHSDNYTYAIEYGLGAMDAVPFYREWCAGKYAHEKIADIAEIDSWDKESSLAFLAGIIDTDGSVFFKSQERKEIVIHICMQAKSVIDACMAIVYKYFQEPMSLYLDDRAKYKNGAVWYAKTTNNLQATRILDALKPHLCHRVGFDYSRLGGFHAGEDRIGLKVGEPYVARTYDITVANDTNLYCLHTGGIVTSNSGKTERFKRFLVKQASLVPGPYFAAAPTHSQAKKIFWDDLKAFTLSACHKRRPSESDLIIYLDNGSEIHVIGLDKPQRIEGIPWKGGGIDEFADIKEEAWEANIYPALNTVNPMDPDYRAWCWLLGVPDGLNHYYDLCSKAESGVSDQYKVFHWMTEEVFPAMAAEAKKVMSAKQYNQEFRAAFETAGGRIYEDYSKENHTDAVIEDHEQIMWMHDQNFTPLSSAIGVRRGNALYLLDEIVLTSAVSKQAALEFVDKYKNHKNKHVLIYGDPAGRAGEKHGHASDYTDIEDVLRDHGWRFTRKVKKAAPAIKDRQNAVRAKVRTADGDISLFINPITAPWCEKGLATVQLKEGSTFQEDQSNKYQHITTAIGYCVDVEWPIIKRIASVTPMRV